MVRINGVALLEIKDPNLGLTGVKNDQMSHYFRNLPVNGHDLYDTENCQLKTEQKNNNNLKLDHTFIKKAKSVIYLTEKGKQ